MVNTAAALNISVEGIGEGQAIPPRYARCVPDGNGQSREGENIRPAISWSKGPDDTRSYMVVVVDMDAPTRFDAANQPGKTIPEALPRKAFYHWVQADIPPHVMGLPEGKAGRVGPGVSGRNSFGERGAEQGIGYDGPCPPWNDERLHHYHFQLYALDVPTLRLKEGFSVEEAQKAMQEHVLAKSETVGAYATNQKRKEAA